MITSVRFAVLGVVWAVLATAMGVVPSPAPAQSDPVPAAQFERWIWSFRIRAIRRGIGQDTLDAALEDVAFLPDVLDRDANQAEFSKPIWTYLDTAVSDLRVANGQEALAQTRATLTEIEARFGIEAEIVTAVWGLESAYGAFRGDIEVVSALATLASSSRRGAFFEDQLVGALSILQSGDVSVAEMTGSWAGAMGHTQFIPTSYLANGQDWNGDGRRDIWSDDPADALASTAAYLREAGWVTGQPWGIEVTLPEGFDYASADRQNTRLPSDWQSDGVIAANGATIPDHAPASILLPAGAEGVAFMIFPNFEALESYNTADAYVIAVGHLADRIAGGSAFTADWPRGDRPLTAADRMDIQRRLTAAGFSTQGIDGKVGPLTIAAIRAYQKANELVPDGYASARLLEHLSR